MRRHAPRGFVYFDHSIRVHNGIGCSSCHGRIDEMRFTAAGRAPFTGALSRLKSRHVYRHGMVSCTG
jgi:hypothetical protein